LALLVYSVSAGSSHAQEPRLKCPRGAKYKKEKVPAQVTNEPYYSQLEEYCQKRNAEGTAVKEGPYVLWGPNSEKQSEGQYVDGKKDGKWIRRIPSQIIEDTWRKG
jgi:hypothetical protein